MSNVVVFNRQGQSAINVFADAIQLLSTIADIEDRTKLRHGMRVGMMSFWLGQAMGNLRLSPLLYYAGLVHDVGAITLPEHIVHYADSPPHHLKERVWAHPRLGAVLVRRIPFLEAVDSWILYHHERIDGRGYPFGIRAEAVSQESQIIYIADIADVQIRKVYKEGRKPDFDELRFRVREIARGGCTSSVYEAFLDEVLVPDKIAALMDDKILEQESVTIKQRLLLPQTDSYSEQEVLKRILEVVAMAIDAKDCYTWGHSFRVAVYAVAIAVRLFGQEEKLEDLRFAALLHDAGKVGIPLSILQKTSSLNATEREIIEKHPLLTEQILSSSQILRHLIPAATSHHEYYDGFGYPRGLRGEEIPLYGRIIAIADVFDALTSERPYRSALSVDEALSYIKKQGGVQFDPKIVAVSDVLKGVWQPQVLAESCIVHASFLPEERFENLVAYLL